MLFDLMTRVYKYMCNKCTGHMSEARINKEPISDQYEDHVTWNNGTARVVSNARDNKMCDP